MFVNLQSIFLTTGMSDSKFVRVWKSWLPNATFISLEAFSAGLISKTKADPEYWQKFRFSSFRSKMMSPIWLKGDVHNLRKLHESVNVA